MTRDEMYSSALDIIYLASCAINNKIPDRDRIDKMNLSAMHAVAEWHMVDSIAAMALISAGVEEPHFMRSRHVAVARNALFNNELKDLIDFLEREKIWYVLLKGTVIKRYYPEEAMRQVGDADIFFDESCRKKVYDYFVSHDFNVESYGKDKHDHYSKLPVYVFEMHVEPLEDLINHHFTEFNNDIKKRLKKNDDSLYGYHLSNEDMYIHMIGHEYNHYNKGGTGLRSLIDTYVFIKRFENVLDVKYIERETEKLGIQDFEKMNRILTMKVFGGEDINPEEYKMLMKIVEAGSYGTVDIKVNNILETYNNDKHRLIHNNKIRYIFGRIFIPMRYVERGYPFFYRHKYLMPLLILYRLGRAITSSRKDVGAEVKALRKNNQNKI